MTVVRRMVAVLVLAVASWAGSPALSVALVMAQESTSEPTRSQKLDSLFARLGGATSQDDADVIAEQIWGMWLQSGDPSIDRDMRLIVIAMNRRELRSAIALLDELIKKVPDYAEAWNKRATVHYLMGRHDASLADIEKTLALEPRHFGALSGRALVLTAQGNAKSALVAVEQALDIHPFLKGARSIIERNGGTFQSREPI